MAGAEGRGHLVLGRAGGAGLGRARRRPHVAGRPRVLALLVGVDRLPKGAVHLHHDMVICLETYAKQVLGIRSTDRVYSAAKLFFAYGLGNALYFPMGVGARERALPVAAHARGRVRGDLRAIVRRSSSPCPRSTRACSR